jgi:SAM-dependent methyltransferase
MTRSFGFWLSARNAISIPDSVISDCRFKRRKSVMAEHQIRFEDGAAYERMMGIWSRLTGEIFLDWLAPRSALRWIDVGCGNGAFTELLAERCTPAQIQGIDPSDGQLAFARGRPSAGVANFQKGDAMALPFAENSFDDAVMALVIFFVPEPAKGVAEMVRVVSPGGIVSAYAWDVLGGGLPAAPIQAEMRAMGMTPPLPPSFEASRLESLRDLWTGAGLDAVETREITVQRTFANFEDFWAINQLGASIAAVVATMSPTDAELLKSRVSKRLPTDAAGRITYSARANAVKGRAPK